MEKSWAKAKYSKEILVNYAAGMEPHPHQRKFLNYIENISQEHHDEDNVLLM